MGDAYRLDEARFIQYATSLSAPNALVISVGPVPDGKVWTITAGSLEPSVDETKVYWFGVLDPGSGLVLPVTWPTSLACVVAAGQIPAFVREGMEFKIYQRETFYGMRGSATAGSTFRIRIRYIESDLPLQDSVDVQDTRKARSGNFLRRAPSLLRYSGGGGGIAQSGGGTGHGRGGWTGREK